MDLPFQPGEFLVRLGVNSRELQPGFHEANPRQDLEFRVAEYCWRLVGLGYLVPQVSSGWGVFYLTERGRAFLRGFDSSSVSNGALDARMAALGYTSNDPARQYVQLAQECFLAGHNEAAVVMLGAATESIVQRVAEALEAAIQSLGVSIRSRPDRPTARQTLTWLTELTALHRRELVKALNAAAKDSGWVEVLADVLNGTGQAIRLSRNELGHPTGVRVSQEEALQLFVLFPRLAEASLRGIDALT
jgi:hypothetical protein